MAGIKGMGQAKPSEVAPAKLQQDAHDEFEAALQAAPKANPQVVAQAAQPDQNAPPPQGTPAPQGSPAPQQDPFEAALSQGGQQPQQSFESPWYTRYLPDVGGIAGGIGGAVLAAPTLSPKKIMAAEVGGAALGGAAGQGLRDAIDTKLLGKPAQSAGQEAADIGKEGLIQGGQQAIGMGIAKGLKLGASAIADSVVKPALEFIGDAVGKAKDEITKPVMDLIGSRTSDFTVEQSGDQAKKLLIGHINDKYQPFVKSYDAISKVTQAMPIQDEARRTLTNSIKDWALENFTGDQYKMIQKFTDDIDAVSNGKQLDNIIKSIGDAQNSAFEKRMTNQGQVLKQLKGMVTEFSEDQTEKVAKAIQSGKATPEQMGFLTQLAQQQGVQEADPTKYAKALATDFLEGKRKITNDYAGFREMLSNIGEQTKLKADKMGPSELIGALNDIPSEKLMDRMFDPKNAAALRAMQKETPEIFDTVIKSKMNQLVEKASVGGELNLNALNKQIGKLPAPTRSLILNSDEMKMLNDVVNNPHLDRLNKLQERGTGFISKWADELARVTTAAQVAGKAGGKSALGKGAGAAVSNVLGRGGALAGQVGYNLGRSLMPQQDQGDQGQ